MSYDPSTRGAAPVGVRTIVLRDESRDGRTVPVELWYPAAESYRGQDLAQATQDRFEAAPGLPSSVQRAIRDAEPTSGSFPLLLFSHGGYSHRRQSTALCTHLASHGYLVAAPDFTGNTAADQIHDMQLGAGATPRLASVVQSATDRPLDVQFVIDSILGGTASELSEFVDGDRIGTLGQSFGGWTTLALNSKDKRPKASVTMVAPWRGGPGPAGALSDMVHLNDWGRDVPTLVLAGERDSIVTLDASRELYRELTPPKRLAVLRGAGHVHFADDPEAVHEELRASWAKDAYATGNMGDAPAFDFVAMAKAMPPFAELCPAAHGEAVAQGLCVAHMDTYLKRLPTARAFLEGDLSSWFGARGIDLEVRSQGD